MPETKHSELGVRRAKWPEGLRQAEFYRPRSPPSIVPVGPLPSSDPARQTANLIVDRFFF